MRGRSRIHFDLHPLAILLGAIVVVGLLAAIVVGPGGVFDWLVNFLLPMAVILLVVVGTITLAVQGARRSWTAGTNRPLRTSGITLEVGASPIRCTGF